MGFSSDGILFFGYQIKENKNYEIPECINYDYYHDEELDPEDYYVIQMGIKSPPKYDGSKEDWERVKPEYDIYWEKKRPIIKECPCEILYLSHYEENIYAVAVKETVKRSYWGMPERIDFNITPEKWAEKFTIWCAELIKYSAVMNIPYDINDFGIYLSSRWG